MVVVMALLDDDHLGVMTMAPAFVMTAVLLDDHGAVLGAGRGRCRQRKARNRQGAQADEKFANTSSPLKIPR